MASPGPAPIVACVGTEPWLRDEAIKALTAASAATSWDTTAFLLNDTPPATILDAARTLPMAGVRRFVIVHGAVDGVKGGCDWLVRYAQQPTPTTCLIVAFEDELPPALRGLPAGTLQEIPCHPLKAGALVAWVRQRASRATNKTLATDAAQTLVARTGPDLSRLAQLIEQLALFVGERPQITSQDVTALVGWSVEERVFAVVDAAVRRDRATALRVTRRLLEEDGVAPEEVLGALGKHVRRLWQVARRAEAGASPQQAVQAAGVPWSAQSAWIPMASRLSSATVTRALERLLETDSQLKTGAGTPLALLEPYVWELASLGQRQAAS